MAKASKLHEISQLRGKDHKLKSCGKIVFCRVLHNACAASLIGKASKRGRTRSNTFTDFPWTFTCLKRTFVVFFPEFFCFCLFTSTDKNTSLNITSVHFQINWMQHFTTNKLFEETICYFLSWKLFDGKCKARFAKIFIICLLDGSVNYSFEKIWLIWWLEKRILMKSF